MATMPLELTDEEIARRAYEIFESEDRGTDEENWLRAEQELRGRPSAAAPKRRRLTTARTVASDKTSRARKSKTSDEKSGELDR
jgi:hypothetical protein